MDLLSRRLFSLPVAMGWCLFINDLFHYKGSPNGIPALLAAVGGFWMASTVALWVLADARERRGGHPLPYSCGLLLFLSWPVSVPVYLFTTRGWRGFLPISAFLCIWLLAALLAFVAVRSLA